MADEQGLREFAGLLSARFQVRRLDLRDEPNGAARLIEETAELLARARRDPLALLAERRSQAAGRTATAGDGTPSTVPSYNHGWDAIVAKAAAHLAPAPAASAQRRDKP